MLRSAIISRASRSTISLPLRLQQPIKYAALRSLSQSHRAYADAAASTPINAIRRPGRPKAHGSTSVKAPRAETAAGPKGQGTTGRPRGATKAAGAKSKKAKAKTKAKPKPKKKPKKKLAPKRVVLTPDQKKRKEIQRLKKVGFVGKEDYDKKPASLLGIVAHEHKGEPAGKGGPNTQAKRLGVMIRELSVSDRERILHTAHRNAKHNQQGLAHWISTHSAQEILAANNARRLLKRKYFVKHGVQPLRDTRRPKRGLSAYLHFWNLKQVERAPGDPITGLARKCAQEWRAMSAEQKKPFEDMAHKDLAKYNAEYLAVYGPKPKMRSIGVQTD